MDRRTLLAIGLMLIVAVLPSILFPPTRTTPPSVEGADSAAVVPPSTPESTRTELPPEPAIMAPVPELTQPDSVAPGEEIVVESELYRLAFSTRGARLVGADLLDYRTFAAGDTGTARIVPAESEFLSYALVFGTDTLWLTDWEFEPSASQVTVRDGGSSLQLVARRGNLGVELTYRFRPDEYLFDVEGRLTGISAGGLVVVGLGPRLALVEADSTDDFRSYAVVTKANKTEQVTFRSLDPGERRDLAGPFEWVAIKTKYFVAAVLTIQDGQPQLGGAVATGGQRSGRNATQADVLMSLPVPAGEFGFSVYVGPQEYRRLSRIGHDLGDVNPYGWIFRPIIRPFANGIVIVLLWMHETLSLAYGWVLVLFGLVVRVVLWPLNQKAMRSSMAMQAIQPELKAVQERHKQDPQRVQQEVMKLYKEHGVNPLGGCLPMLIPMPVLFALFFVFRQTIEFRGVPFLWLPDLSRADPYFIIPIVMGLSMFAVTKLGQVGVPPNPQAKMMLYVMPAFLTFIFLRLSSGLNLYYAVSNIASIPQQWLIAKERLRRVGKRE
jgi:YidC/Oxa1 family membrane protein insertase